MPSTLTQDIVLGSCGQGTRLAKNPEDIYTRSRPKFALCRFKAVRPLLRIVISDSCLSKFKNGHRRRYLIHPHPQSVLQPSQRPTRTFDFHCSDISFSCAPDGIGYDYMFVVRNGHSKYGRLGRGFLSTECMPPNSCVLHQVKADRSAHKRSSSALTG